MEEVPTVVPAGDAEPVVDTEATEEEKVAE